MDKHGIRAFSDPNYDYYLLKKDIGHFKAGAIFVHDPDDNVYGSIANGCLKLCWTPEGGCYNMLAANTIILHTWFTEDEDLFEHIGTDVLKFKTSVLSYIDRIKKSGMGKDKSLEYIQKFVERYEKEES